MPDKIDLAQNKAIKAVEDDIGEIKKRLSSLEKRVADHDGLMPLAPLVERVSQILRHFGVVG